MFNWSSSTVRVKTRRITAPSVLRVERSTPLTFGVVRMRERMAFHSRGLVKGTVMARDWVVLALKAASSAASLSAASR